MRPKENNNFSNTSSIDSYTVSYATNGIPKFITGNVSDTKVTNEESAFSALGNIKELNITNSHEEFELDSIQTVEDSTYYKFQQFYNGLEVYQQNAILAVDKDGNVTSFSGYYVPDITLLTTEELSEEEMKTTIENQTSEETEIPFIEKKIYVSEENIATVVYDAIVITENIAEEWLIDASNGDIIIKVNLGSEALYEYTGNDINDIQYTINIDEVHYEAFNEPRYNFVDPARNIIISDCSNLDPTASTFVSFLLNNDLISTPFTASMQDGVLFSIYEDTLKNAVTTMAHYEIIYDYYKNILNRDSYDNQGSPIYVCINVSDKMFSSQGWSNAAWVRSPFNRMIIGDYNGTSLSLSLDILGHEFTHGVISQTAKFAKTPKDLNKANESGALDEGYADIFGAIIEGKNWITGDANNLSASLIRDLSDPEAYGYPARKNSENYYPDGYFNGRTLEQFLEDNQFETLQDYDSGGIHRNSTVVGYAAYLMYHNNAFNDMEEMAKVWYQSLFLLSSYSDFEDCALAVIEVAKQMGLTSDKIQIIHDAFVQTNMLEEDKYTIKGSVKSGETYLENVTIEVYDKETNTLIDTYNSAEDGTFQFELERGIYSLKFQKDSFEEKTVDVILNGNTTLNIQLAFSIDDQNNLCTTGNCHTFTIYTYVMDGNCFVEKPESFLVDDGLVVDLNVVSEGLNLTFNGTEASINVGGMTIPINYYYRGTKTKYDWSAPVTEDIEIELALNIDVDFLNAMSGCEKS